MSPEFFALALVVVLLAINVQATRRVARSGEQGLRKVMLMGGVWVLPFLGAWLVKTHLPSALGSAVGDARAGEAEPAPSSLEAPGLARFDVMAHLQNSDDLPQLDWPALDAWAHGVTGATGDHAREVAAEALNQGRRAWLLHLRNVLGTEMHLHDGADCFILSPLESSVARATARYVSTTRQRIDRLLNGMAHFPVAEKSILLVLPDEDTYYRYVAQFYGEDGEFARSGGMFIHFGCPHFVVVAADLAAIEPVIAHEMTHNALAHLRLPTWLDEGLAVNTERRLKGTPPAQHTPAQLHHLHQRFWTPERMQEFWAGTSFHRTDDGNLLSYELARILVDHMARDWAAFTAFVTAAQRSDAGAQAAEEVLSVDLGRSVGTLLDIDDNKGWAPDPARWGNAAF
ncbi:MAG: hypothetical protein KKG67_06815 [Gammaproteobacteria bacterium]|nr:hypothetical protein [Gammaproteobacteria bacterium]